jgi:hypothetical protein
MAKEFFEIGDFLTGSYPRHNLEGYRTGKRIQRTFQLTMIRDLNIAPLEEQTLAATPLTCRSDILLTGIDLDSGEQRSFYLASFEGLRRVAPGEIRGNAPAVLVFKKRGGIAAKESLPDTDRQIFCDYFNRKPGEFVAVPQG